MSAAGCSHSESIGILLALDVSQVDEFLRPISVQSLRRVLRMAPRSMQRRLLRGFRIDTLPRERAIRVIQEGLRGPEAFDVAHQVFEQWRSARPDLGSITQRYLLRDDMFSGPLTDAFVAALGPDLDVGTSSVLRGFVWSVDEIGSPAGSIAARPARTARQGPRVFESVLDRDQWIVATADQRLLPESERDRLKDLPGESDAASRDGLLGYAANSATAAEAAARWHVAASYWFAAAGLRRASGHPGSSEMDGFLACSMKALGAPIDVEDVAEGVSLALESPSVPLRQDVCRLLIRAISLNSDSLERYVSRRARAELGKRAEDLFPRQKRLIAAARGAEPSLLVLARDYTDQRAQLSLALGEFLANPNLDELVRMREPIITALSRMEAYQLTAERPLSTRVEKLLGRALTAYVEASPGEDEGALEEFEALVEEYWAESLRNEPEFGSVMLAPLVAATTNSLSDHYLGEVHARLPDIKCLVRKPATVHGEDWSFDLEVRNDGRGVARDLNVAIRADRSSGSVLFEPQELRLGDLPIGQAEIRQVHAVADEAAQSIEMSVAIEYSDRAGQHAGRIATKVLRRRDTDWAELELLIPYSILSISDPGKLKGRGEALKVLRQGFRAKSSFMITGQRRVGKTSLTKVFLAELRSDPSAIPIHIPLGEISAAGGDGDLGRLGRDIADRVAEAYSLATGDDPPPTPALSEFRDGFNATFSSFFRQLHRRRANVHLVIGFDDFDELPTALFTGDIGRRFFMALRAVVDGGASFLFVGSERLPAIMREQEGRLNLVKPLPLDYLSIEALRELVVAPTIGHIEFGDDAVRAIETWSGRNPYFATLICMAIWERALKHRDATVGELDVARAIEQVVEESPAGHFQHFWSDSPTADYDDRAFAESKSSAVLVGMVSLQSESSAFASRAAIAKATSLLTQQEAEDQTDALIARGVLETSPTEPALVRARVPLFASWLRRHTDSVRRPGSVPVHRRSTPRDLEREEVAPIADRLMYQGHKISTDDVRRWCAQFGPLDDQRIMLNILRGVGERGLFDLERFYAAIRALDSMVTRAASERGIVGIKGERNRTQNRYVTHVDPPGKSGSLVTKEYRSHNKIFERLAGTPERVIASISEATGPAVLVCVNDFVGSGLSAAEGIQETLLPLLERDVPDWRERILVAYVAVAGFAAGADYIRSQIPEEIEVIIAHPLDDADRAFHASNPLFASFEERERARELAYKYGSMLERRQPLGWEDSEALVVFYNTVPNNSLPILYKSGTINEDVAWYAMFPR